MIINTTRVRFDDELADFDEMMESTEIGDFKLIPCTIKISVIDRFEPCAINEDWTEVYLVDGEIIILGTTYQEFLFQYQIASKLDVNETWQPNKSKDGKIQIRTYLN